MNAPTDLLAQLIRTDTVNPPGHELQAATLLADWLHQHDVEVEIDEFAPGRANLLAAVRFTRPGPTLMLNTHLDVVPVADGWTVDPFAGAITNDVIWGRGAADAKGALAAMAAALTRLAADPDRLSGSLVLTAVADEEDGSRGARRLVAQRSADAVVVGEPTDLRLMTAHKGSVRPVIQVRGRAAHAAQPQHGRNAIAGAAALIRALQEYAATLSHSVHPLVGPATAVPVLIDGGEAPNAVPERVRITLDRRMTPGETTDGVLEQLHQLLQRFHDTADGFHAEIVAMKPSTGGPSETPADDPFVLACQRGLTRLGLDPRPQGLVVNCDMTHFRAQRIPTVVCGPGHPEVMHAADEHLQLQALNQAVDVYVAIAEEVLAP